MIKTTSPTAAFFCIISKFHFVLFTVNEEVQGSCKIASASDFHSFQACLLPDIIMCNNLLRSLSAVHDFILIFNHCIFAILSKMWPAALEGQRGKGPVMAMTPILTNASDNFDSNRAKYSVHSVIAC